MSSGTRLVTDLQHRQRGTAPYFIPHRHSFRPVFLTHKRPAPAPLSDSAAGHFSYSHSVNFFHFFVRKKHSIIPAPAVTTQEPMVKYHPNRSDSQANP